MNWEDIIKKNTNQLKEFLLEHLDKDIQYMQSNPELNPEHLKMRFEFYKKMLEQLQ